MNLLALELSSSQRSVAVIQGAALPGEISRRNSASSLGRASHRESEVIETGGSGSASTRTAASRASHPFAMIEEALQSSALEREQIDLLAIGVGPGSYAGIRSTIAIAQGWQLANSHVKVLAVSSAECLAAQAHANGIFGQVFVVIDAQRQEFYVAGFEVSDEGWKDTQPLHLATMTEVQTVARRGILIGPEVTKWFPEGRVMFPRAATLGQLALGRSNFVPSEKLEPIYLRETKFVKAPLPRILPEPFHKR